MSEYGSGISFARACAYDKERIKEALKGRQMFDEDENGFKYRKASKEECDGFIVSAYDNVVYHAREAMCSARALEKYMKSKGIEIDLDTYMKFYYEEQMHDSEKGEYHYEGEECD